MPYDSEILILTKSNVKIYLPSKEEICAAEKNFKIRKIDNLIKKHSDRLKTIKENQAKEFDRLSDKELESFGFSIQLVAEFCTDLRKLKKDLFDTK